MFKRLARGIQHTATLLWTCLSPARRRLLWRMAAFSRALPRQFDQPLPLMMAQLTPPPRSGTVIAESSSRPLAEAEIRRLADAVAAWHLSSPLGICLRRSLLRYYFLREKGLPLRIIFGARLKSGQEGGGIGGHAWLTLHELPYYENKNDYEGFMEMYHYPPDEKVKVKAASQFEKS